MARKIKELVQQYYAMWNSADFKKANTLLHPDIRFQGSLGFNIDGIEAFREYALEITQAFPNLYHATEIVICEDDIASVYVLYTGTHKGKLYDLEATGNSIRYNGATFFTLEDDKFSKIRVLGDRYTLFEQLGLFQLNEQTINMPRSL
jgi:predicted ester cyclase